MVNGTRILPAFCALLLIATAAGADDQQGPAPAAASGLESAADSVATFASAVPVSSETLGEMNGKAQLQVDKIQVNDRQVNGVVTDNVATNNLTGHNTISEGSYTNAAGFMTTIQNTGNNVLIQNATIVNLTVQP